MADFSKQSPPKSVTNPQPTGQPLPTPQPQPPPISDKPPTIQTQAIPTQIAPDMNPMQLPPTSNLASSPPTTQIPMGDTTQTSPLGEPPPDSTPPIEPISTHPPKPGAPTTKPDKQVKKSPFRFLTPLIIILALIGIIFFIYKFISGRTVGDQAITLSYWGLWETSQDLEPIFTKFEQENPGTQVNYVQQSPQDYRERLQAAIARGQGPDLFRFHNTWVHQIKKDLASLPNEIMSRSQFESTFYPVTHQDLRVGNNIVGIPLEFDGLALYYNKRMLTSAGKQPPKTWEELRILANELTIRDNADRIIRSGVALGTTNNVDHWPDIVGLMMLQNSANPADPTSQLAQDAISFFTIFSQSDHVWDSTLPGSTLAFANEQVVMMIAPSWRALDVKSLNPSLDFATAPVPQLPDSNLNWASYWAEGVSNQVSQEKQELAWKLLKYLSQADTMRSLYASLSQTRLFGEPYSRMDLSSELEADPVVGAIISSAPTAQSWYMASWTLDNGLNDRIIKYYEDAINAINDGRSVSQSLETAGQGVVQVLSQFGVSGALQ